MTHGPDGSPKGEKPQALSAQHESGNSPGNPSISRTPTMTTPNEVAGLTKVTPEMLKAYVEWDPPCSVDVSTPARALGLVRAAFFAGWLASPTEAPEPLVERVARKHIETLEFLATQYLPGGPRDIKGALAAARAALSSSISNAETPDPFAWVGGLKWHAPAHRAVVASVKLGAWLSAALDDPKVCDAMKADIREWFSAGEPMEILGQAATHFAARPTATEDGEVVQADVHEVVRSALQRLGYWQFEMVLGGDGGFEADWRTKEGHARLAARQSLDSGALGSIAAERRRQVMEEGYTPEHDDGYTNGALPAAAAMYADSARGEPFSETRWPWHPRWWKPVDPRRSLVKAGALIVAEIERIDRNSLSNSPSDGEGDHG